MHRKIWDNGKKYLFTSEAVSEGHPDNEIWKPIAGYGGIYRDRYEVSNLGRVRSKDLHVTRTTRSGRKYEFLQKGRILKTTLIAGYPALTLTDGKGEKEGKKTELVHRLVGFTFVDGYKEGLEINHKDENRENNHADNLEWVTRKENINYGYHNYRMSVTKGSPIWQMTLEGKIIRGFYSIAQASRETGIQRENIGKCCLNKVGYKTAGGYKWRFKDNF